MSNNTIGFYCPIISGNQKDNIICEVLNKLSDNHETILFNSEYHPIGENNKFCILHCNQAKYFYGKLLCFDIDSLVIIDTFPGPSQRILVADDIFWQNKNIPFITWNQMIFSNTDIITTNQKTHDLYEICFKKPLYSINNLDSQELTNVIQKLCKND